MHFTEATMNVCLSVSHEKDYLLIRHTGWQAKWLRPRLDYNIKRGILSNCYKKRDTVGSDFTKSAVMLPSRESCQLQSWYEHECAMPLCFCSKIYKMDLSNSISHLCNCTSLTIIWHTKHKNKHAKAYLQKNERNLHAEQSPHEKKNDWIYTYTGSYMIYWRKTKKN